MPSITALSPLFTTSTHPTLNDKQYQYQPAQRSIRMSQAEPNSRWSDQVNDSDSSTNDSKTNVETSCAIKWGEKVKITDDLIAQICPADLANYVCDFDYVMPNGCDHNCEMLRLCEVYVAHCGYECPNTDSNNLPCPYVHGVLISCSSVNHQYTVDLAKKALNESLGKSWKTPDELKKEERNKKKAKGERDRFTCTNLLARNECPRGHDHQAARLASYALLQKHQHTGRIVRGSETETFDEKMAREAEQHRGTRSKSTISEEETLVPEGATLTLVVQNLAYVTTEEDLKAAFEQYGDVRRAKILEKDGTPTGTSFVDFTKLEHSTRALNAMQGAKLDGRPLRVKFKGDKADGAGGSSRACHSCGQEGHFSRECPSKESNQGGSSRACYSCGEEGHISRDCPSKESSQGGRGGGYGGGQFQSIGEGGTATEGETATGSRSGGAGETTTQGDWDAASNNATLSSSQVVNQQW